MFSYNRKHFAVIWCYGADDSSFLCRHNGFYNFSCSWSIPLNFKHINPWHWKNVCFDWGGGGYCNPTCLQTRGPKVKKWMPLLFVHGLWVIDEPWKGFTVVFSKMDLKMAQIQKFCIFGSIFLGSARKALPKLP